MTSLSVFSQAATIHKDAEEERMLALLAKLLAEEDVATVISPTFRTAFFDLKRRMIGIPEWKNMPRALKLVLRFHEVSHGLFSDTESFHDFVEGKYPRALAGIINICEDDRCDRKMVSKFPGMKPVYAEGYKHIVKRFWDKLDYSKCTFADKLNLDSKARNDFPMVTSNEIEEVLYYRFKNTETPEDVITLAQEIYEYCKQESLTDNHDQQEKEQGENSESQEASEGAQGEPSDQEGQEGQEGDSDQEGTGGEQGEESSSDSDQDGEPEGEQDSEGSEGGEAQDGSESDSKDDTEMKDQGSQNAENSKEGGSTNEEENFTKTQDYFKDAEESIIEENYTGEKMKNRWGQEVGVFDHTMILRAKPSNFIPASVVKDIFKKAF